MVRPPRIVIVCPFYYCTDPTRAEITRRIFRHYKNLGHPFIGVGSEGDTSRELFGSVVGVTDGYYEYEQHFDCATLPIPGAGCIGLRQKFDYAIAAAKIFDPDYVFITGSDDLTPRAFFDHLGADLIGIGDAAHGGGTNMWRTGTQGYARIAHSGFAGTTLCGGPLGFSRRYLNSIDWHPFVLPNCEVGAERLAVQHGATIEALPLDFWQVKSGACLNPIGDFAHRWKWHEPDEPFAAFRAYWDSLA